MNKFSTFVFIFFSILFVSCNSCATQGASTERDTVNEYYTLVTDDDKEKNPQIAKKELPQIETLREVKAPEDIVVVEKKPEIPQIEPEPEPPIAEKEAEPEPEPPVIAEPEPEPPKEPEKPVVVAKAAPEPKKEEPKPAVQKPITQQKPVTQQKPTTQQKPATQQKPTTQQKPVTQQKPEEKPPVAEEPVKEAPKVEEPKVEEPEPPKEPEKTAMTDEYERSINGMEGNVSIEDFNDDKQKILQIISELSGVMNEKNYDKWLTYIEPASITYWQSTSNLAVASQRLPVSVRSQLAGNRLRNLREYFVYLFVPARKGRNVDEIRYISPESVKAVQVTEEADLIYYNFKKIDGKWLVHLPVNS